MLLSFFISLAVLCVLSLIVSVVLCSKMGDLVVVDTQGESAAQAESDIEPQRRGCDRCRRTFAWPEDGGVYCIHWGVVLYYCRARCYVDASYRLSSRAKVSAVVRNMNVQERVRIGVLMTLVLTMGGEYGDLVGLVSPYLTFRQRMVWREACGNHFRLPSLTAMRMHRLFVHERARTKRLKMTIRSLKVEVETLQEEKDELESEKDDMYTSADLDDHIQEKLDEVKDEVWRNVSARVWDNIPDDIFTV